MKTPFFPEEKENLRGEKPNGREGDGKAGDGYSRYVLETASKEVEAAIEGIR